MINTNLSPDSNKEEALFKANYDKDTPVVNNLPYTILTKRVRILPTQWKGKTAALRAEFIGCKNGCLKSLGVAQNPPSSGQVINNVPDRHVEKTDFTQSFFTNV